MDTIFTDDADSCETYCSSVGDIQQGSVAWTYYTDESKSCVCWRYFDDLGGTEYSNTDAISGRFVDEGAPSTDNCGNKCRAYGRFQVIISVHALDDCKAKCEEYGKELGMRYQVSSTNCFCPNELFTSAKWDADYITVRF